ncbi:Polyadenylate-binding protein RBP47B' [Zea mays]|uniref:Polyadenylate-binding protein RBP47B n=2 Tax=Zea mays TaxID=4577 RepID=C4IYK3_MAIZE|nr:Polyadenylate-binding protein RBP47B' [Zea mays]ACR34003.1 unknown [Zea mays]ONL94148.1 Polyadenylate-binding protein RBP47B' [Zea mays]
MAAPYHQPTSLEEVRTLWIGDLQYWTDENYLYSCFAHTGEVQSVKIIRNKVTSLPEGYGFIEFVSHEAAEKILQTYNGTQMPGTEHTFRLNWASFSSGERRPDPGSDHSIFVGDLAPDVTDYLLQETFRVNYSSVRGAKVVTDPNTGRSKGYGFVKFADENEKNRAMTEMNGVYCSTRPMRISAAIPKKSTGSQLQYSAAKAVYPATAYAMPQLQAVLPDSDPTNTTIFIGNLDPNVIEDELRQICVQFGELIYVKIPVGKGCGFVQYASRASAEEAVQRLHGTMIGQQAVRLSWGRSPASKQDSSAVWSQQADPNQWANTYYGYGYDAYGYAQDPSYAYGAYAGYSQYPQQVEGTVDATSVAGSHPGMEQKEEPYDPMNIPDVDKLNASYMAVHGRAMLGRSLWLKTNPLPQPT